MNAKAHRDACFAQSGEGGHPEQVAISQGSTANESIAEAVEVAEEVSIFVRVNQDSWKSCSTPKYPMSDRSCCLANLKIGGLDGVLLTWNRSLVLLNLSAAESFAFRA